MLDFLKYLKKECGEVLIGAGVLVVSLILILVNHSGVELPNKIEIGSMTFNLYGLLMAFGFLIPYFIFEKRIQRDEELREIQFFWQDVVFIIIGSVLGARLLHVIADWDQIYSKDPMRSFRLWEGGVSWFGALAFGFLSLAVVSSRRKYNFGKLLDYAALGVALVQMISRFGNFLNQELFGPPTDLPWGIYIESAKRPEEFSSFEYFHPAYFYEQLGNFIILAVLFSIYGLCMKHMVAGSPRRSASPSGFKGSLCRMFQVGNGNITLMYLLMYGFVRFVVEQFRMHPDWSLGLSFGELSSVVFILVALILLPVRFVRLSRS